jgi:hypothetical protein
MKNGTGLCLALIALLLTSNLAASASHGEPPAPGAEALALGFRVASAIETDPDNKGRAQTEIVLAFAHAGDLDGALARVDQVEGWYLGQAYAQLAVLLARQGRVDEARRLVEKGRVARESVEGWKGARVESFLARALAYLGEVEDSRAAAQRAERADARQYAGQAAATVARGHAARGDFDAAMEELARIDHETQLDTAWWRTLGYVELAGEDRFSPEQRSQALERALASAGKVPGWKRVEALRRIADEFVEAGNPKRARQVLAGAETFLVEGESREGSGEGAADRRLPAPLLIGLARSWAGAGKPKRAAELLREAEQNAMHEMSIDRPGIFAHIGAGWHAVGEPQEAWRVFDLALGMSERLANARPRALAVVEICRSLGDEGIVLTPQARERLEALHAGLGAPW